jgi:hypothetical protein
MLFSGQFIRRLRAGHYGVRLRTPRSLRVLEKHPLGAHMADSDNHVGWHFGLSRLVLDLRADYEADLRADVESSARFLFDEEYKCFMQEAESAGQPGDEFTTALAKSYGPRTADPDWSPVVELECLEIDSCPALKVIYRHAYRPGCESVVGHLLVPAEAGTLECTAVSRNDTTGMRESFLFATLEANRGAEDDQDADAKWPAIQLTQSEIDDPAHDDLVPFHCLSVVRSAMRWLLAPAGAALEILAPAPSIPLGEIRLPQVGVVITPPPRYVPAAPGLGKTLRADMALFARASIPDVPPRTLDVLRMPTPKLYGPERTNRLEQLACSEPLEWAREGAWGIDVETEVLPRQADQVHVASYIQYEVLTGPTHTVARWRADADGEVFRIAVGGPPLVSREILARDADAVARSLRRLDF